MRKTITAPVFPSKKLTVSVEDDKDHGGAHNYTFVNSLGFSEGEAKYDTSTQSIQFVQKNVDGTMTPGVQSEQIVIALLDRTAKLNGRFPSEHNEKMMNGLNTFLDACQERIEDRISRGVMGDLKK